MADTEQHVDRVPRCGRVFTDRQGRIEGVCLDPVVPGTPWCTEHYVEHVARKDGAR